MSGVSYSLSFVLVKILPLMFLPAMFAGAHRRAKWLLSAAFFPVIVYGWFVIHKIDVMVPLRAERRLVTPANIPFLATFLSGFELPLHLVNIVLLLAVGIAVAIAVRAQLSSTMAQSFWRLSLSMLFVLLTLLLFSKKSDPIYLSMCFFLLSAFTAVQVEGLFRWVQYPYALMSLLGLPIASFWYWPLGAAGDVELHAMLLAGNPLRHSNGNRADRFVGRLCAVGCEDFWRIA